MAQRALQAVIAARAKRLVVAALLVGLPLVTAVPSGAAAAQPIGPWQANDQLPAPLENEVLVSDGTYLYAAGGANSARAQAGVYSTQVAADGSFQGGPLAGWSQQPSLPLGIYNHAGTLAGGYLVITGGETGEHTGVQDAVYTAPVSNGAVGGWSSSTPLPTAVMDHLCVTDGAGHILVLGGFEPPHGPVAAAYVATLNSDGTLGPWSATTPLPEPLGEATAAVAGGYLYVAGGHTTGYAPVADVFGAPINADGTLGQWTKLASLPQAPWDAAMVSSGASLFVVGGFAGHHVPQKTVYRADIASNGTIGAWQAETALPRGMAELGAAVANGWLFAAGTRVGTTEGSTIVFNASLPGPGGGLRSHGADEAKFAVPTAPR